MAQEWLEAFHQLLTGCHVALFVAPAGRPLIEIGAIGGKLVFTQARRFGRRHSRLGSMVSGSRRHARHHPPQPMLHTYLTLVYQIEQGCIRLLWIGKDRTVEGFEQFFNLIGKTTSDGIQFVCSDMWKPYLRVIRERCANAVNILDRFHIVAKMNDALDDVRAAEARRLIEDGYQPVLKKTRWCVLKRKANLTTLQRFRLRDLLHYNLKTVRA